MTKKYENYLPNNFLSEVNKFEISGTEDNIPKISIVIPSHNQAKFIEKVFYQF